LIVIEYLKYFHKHVKAIGVYRLLLLDGYGSYATFEFKKFANDYKIIFLYLSAYTTHRLQLLDVGIFGLLTYFYFNEVVQYFRWFGFIGKSVKIFDKIGARISALKALKTLKKLDTAQIIYLKNRNSFKQLRIYIL
jgi:hypothetical protein